MPSLLVKIEKSLSQGFTDWDVGRGDLQDINKTLGELTAEQKTNVIAGLSDDQLQTWGREIDGTRGSLYQTEKTDLYNDLSSGLDAAQLTRIYDNFGEQHHSGLITAVENNASNETLSTVVDAIQRNALTKVEIPNGLSPEEKELYLDLGQLSLDLVGIVEPTPFADGNNRVISLFRGDWLGAGLSAASVIPYVGDLAKLGKLGKWAQTVTNAIEVAGENEKFAAVAKPILEKIGETIGSMPQSVIGKLPQRAQDTLGSVKSQIDEFSNGVARATNTITKGGKGNNSVEWVKDSQGRIVEARATLTETFGSLTRGKAEKEAQSTVAAKGIEGDHGGHIVPHRLVGDQGAINMFPRNGVREVKIDTTTGKPVIDPKTGEPEIMKNFNGSAYKAMENEIVDWLEAGASVEFKVRFTEFDGARPAKVHYDYEVRNDAGKVVYKNTNHFNNQAGEIFQRISKSDIARLL